MAWSDASFDPDRAVAVIQDGKQRASGYVVAAGLVLTSQHFLRTGRLEVRPRASSLAAPASLVCSSHAADAALLRCHGWDDVAPVAIGVVEPVGRDSLTFEMYGWPLWSTETAPDHSLREGGRLVRGIFEPSDTSPEGNLVLQPHRTGGSVRSGWSGMSGAAVFSLDRLVGIQRRLVREDDATSIEARPAAPLMEDPDFERVAREAGITLESQWAPRRTGGPRGERLEVHGPSHVPLLSPVSVQLRVDGWPTVSYSFSGVRNGLHQYESLAASPLVDVPVIFFDAEKVGAAGRILIEATGGERDDRTIAHGLRIDGPDVSDVVTGYETVVRVLETVRAGGSPSMRLRAADLCAAGLGRVSAAARLLDSSGAADAVLVGLSGASECLAVERSQINRELADPEFAASKEYREMSKYAFHRAYMTRLSLRESGIALPADERTDAERDAAMLLLGFRHHAAYLEHLDPGISTLLADQDPYIMSFLRLLRSGDVDVRHPDFTRAVPQVQAKTYDLVNALVRDGWARWVARYQLTLTQVGRAALDVA
ncbi:trypsin-like peptidase domain-containing protein [Microbacterium sp. LMI12-1-1.1]|uniref:hypothetical protein n=1 Tax=Microbacterium sp. LMI12-1-1.1 TaxID=3135225 RepID=UPI00342AAD93